MPRYGIAEWYGHRLAEMTLPERRELASTALHHKDELPPCPFQKGLPTCRKSGGVCSIQLYRDDGAGYASASEDGPVIVCPARFEQGDLLISWLGEIVGFPRANMYMAREVPFMESIATSKPAGKIDLVVARTDQGRLEWYGLEIQAVYFSGPGMSSEFRALLDEESPSIPYPSHTRRPDWRSSSAKRLMPQLQVKVPTVRRWGAKMAVAVDQPFFEAIGGPSPNFSRDLGDGDIIWLVPKLVLGDEGTYRLEKAHWEVLTLEASNEKLLAARTIQQSEFEAILRSKLTHSPLLTGGTYDRHCPPRDR